MPVPFARIVALVAAVTTVSLLVVSPVRAEPEGGTQALRDALAAASKGYSDAKTRIANAKKQQVELAGQVTAGEVKVAELTAAVGRLAATLGTLT